MKDARTRLADAIAKLSEIMLADATTEDGDPLSIGEAMLVGHKVRTAINSLEMTYKVIEPYRRSILRGEV